MGLQSFSTNSAVIAVKRSRFYVGNQDNIDAWYVKTRYEVNSSQLVDRKLFTFIEDRDGIKIKACAMYVDYTGHSITIHVHAPKALRKNTIKKFLQYPFKDLGVKILFTSVRSSNKIALNIDRKIGFKDYAVIKDYFGPNEDRIILSAQESDIKRWLE